MVIKPLLLIKSGFVILLLKQLNSYNKLKSIYYKLYNKMQELNIVELIEKNPISKLSKVYNNKLISKIQ